MDEHYNMRIITMLNAQRSNHKITKRQSAAVEEGSLRGELSIPEESYLSRSKIRQPKQQTMPERSIHCYDKSISKPADFRMRK